MHSCGQGKTVHVHRFIALDTIDRTLYGERSGRSAADIDAALAACEPFKLSKDQIAVSLRIKDERRSKAKAKAEAGSDEDEKPKSKVRSCGLLFDSTSG